MIENFIPSGEVIIRHCVTYCAIKGKPNVKDFNNYLKKKKKQKRSGTKIKILFFGRFLYLIGYQN